jgi:hypothetical protein
MVSSWPAWFVFPDAGRDPGVEDFLFPGWRLSRPRQQAAQVHGRSWPAAIGRGPGKFRPREAGTTVAVSSLLHFSDLRWLPPSQRGTPHLSAPGGVLGFARPTVKVVNSVAGLPVEWRAVQASVHTAILCALLAVAALALVVLTARRACRADIRQIVQEEMRRGGQR